MNYDKFLIEYEKLKEDQALISKPNFEQKLQFKHRHWDLHQKYLTSQILKIQNKFPKKEVSK